MAKEWHSINDLYFVSGKKKPEPEPVDMDEVEEQQAEEEIELRLSDPKFIRPDEGYKANKPCKMQVSAEYLKKTNRARVLFDVFSSYKENEVQEYSSLEGFIEDGVAIAEMKYLPLNEDYAHDNEKAEDATYNVRFVAYHSKGKKPVESSVLEMPISQKRKINIVEIPDITFNLNSAIPCLDENNKLISGIITAFEYSTEHTEEELVICGHTDKSGEIEYNYELSELRAKAVKAMLDNDSAAWVDISKEKSKVEDYQLISKTLNDNYGWSCDPGKIDNIDGPKTQEGLKKFQSFYNKKYNESIKEDGKIGTETWKSIHKVLYSIIESSYKKEYDKEILPKLQYRSDDEGIFPCGESFPIDNEYKTDYHSKKDRRVELVFYEKENPPEIKKTLDKKENITKKMCQIYDTAISLFTVILSKVINPEPVKKDINLSIVYPEKSPHKQYINLDKNGKELGPELKIVIKAEGAGDGDEVTWKVTADKDNSIRNDKVPYLNDSVSGDKEKIKKQEAEIKSKVTGEKAEIIFYCGAAGGDKFNFEIESGNAKIELSVENYRKFWYQLTHQKGLKIPSLNTSKTAFTNVFAEMEDSNIKKEFEKSDLGDLSKKGITTFYKEWVINPGGSDKEVAVLGSHNRDFFYKYYDKDKEKGKYPRVHLMICQHQWDENTDDYGKAITTEPINYQLTKSVSSEIDVVKKIFSPYLKDKVVINGKWKSLAPKGHPDFNKKGSMNDDWILIEKNRTSREHIKIRIPVTVKVTPDKKAPIQISFKLNTVAGPYLGESNAQQILAVLDPKNVTDFNNTITHEIGHSFNQVPESSKKSPGLSNHPNQYTGHGGSGSHCNTVHNAKKEEIAGALNKDNEYSTGICVMFHAGDSTCINEFCSFCKPYIKATDFSDFKLK